jgi:hypothetical protein
MFGVGEGEREEDEEGSRRVVISCRRDGPAGGRNQQGTGERKEWHSPVTQMTGISGYGRAGRISEYALWTWLMTADTIGSWRSLIIPWREEDKDGRRIKEGGGTNVDSIHTLCPGCSICFHSHLVPVLQVPFLEGTVLHGYGLVVFILC